MRKYVPDGVRLVPRGAERKFQGEIFEVFQWPQEMFDGSVATFEMLKRDDTVGVVAILTADEAAKLRSNKAERAEEERRSGDSGREALQSEAERETGGAERGTRSSRGETGGAESEDKIVIIYQTQPTQEWFYAFPGGRCDHPEENELEAAQREMREETGLSFRNWKLVDARQVYSKIDWIDYIFIATGLIDEVPQELDAGEKIEVCTVTFRELKELAEQSDAERLAIKVLREAESLGELRGLPELNAY